MSKYKTAKLKSINIDVYDFTLFYLISSWKYCVKIVKEKFDCDLESVALGNGYAFPLTNDDNQQSYFIWIENNADDSVIVHEAFHATAHIMNGFAGIKLDNNAEEAYAYLLGYITRELFKNRRMSRRRKKRLKRKR